MYVYNVNICTQKLIKGYVHDIVLAGKSDFELNLVAQDFSLQASGAYNASASGSVSGSAIYIPIPSIPSGKLAIARVAGK